MSGIDTAALPLDFIALTGGRGRAVEACSFVAGEALPASPAVGRVVFHAGVSESALAVWQSAGALCIAADRVLGLIAPEAVQSAPAEDARALGSRYVDAVRRLEPNTEVLRVAAEALQDLDASLAALLRRGLAQLAIATVGARPASGASLPAAPGPFHASDFAGLDSHAQLDRLFEHLNASGEAPGGVVFEPRPGQRDMAHAVLDAFLSRDTLVVEAGTGVGKTLAYVLPAVLLAVTHGGRFVLSTHTRTLQQQLAGRDLPAVWHRLGLDRLPGGRTLRAAKLLGRANYLCRQALVRWAAATARAGHGFTAAQVLVATLRPGGDEIEDLASRLELDAGVVRALAAHRDVCQGVACRGPHPCPVHAAREAARTADLVVVNHALLLSDAQVDRSLLGPRDGLVLDEAHHVEAVATECISVRVGATLADGLVTPLGRLVAATEDSSPSLVAGREALGRAAAAARHAFAQLWTDLDAALPRARRARVRYHDADEVWGVVRAPLASLRRDLATIAAEALALQRRFESESPDAESIAAAGEELQRIAAAASELDAALEFVARGGREDWTFYLDFGPQAGALHEVVAAPLDVAPVIQELLAGVEGARVYTSATLRTGADCGYFRTRAGIERDAPELVVPSPFDFARQCVVVQAEHVAGYAERAYDEDVAALLADIALRTHRRMLVLCTSHAGVRGIATALRRRLTDSILVLSQAVGGGRDRMAARFAATPGAILVGTSSFWEGVDFPGRALEILVVAKLPFQPPDEPLVDARCERLRSWGEDAFSSYVLPEAVLRFKQGFGRLIRTRTDRGVAILLDARLGTRDYAAEFHAALPVVPESYRDADALVDRVVEWFEAPAAAALVPPEADA